MVVVPRESRGGKRKRRLTHMIHTRVPDTLSMFLNRTARLRDPTRSIVPLCQSSLRGYFNSMIGPCDGTVFFGGNLNSALIRCEDELDDYDFTKGM